MAGLQLFIIADDYNALSTWTIQCRQEHIYRNEAAA